MENSHSLATESFSYSWLINKNPSFNSDSSHEATSKETKYNFNFDIPISKSSPPLVHADEIFSDGHIKPTYVDRSKGEDTFNTSITSLPVISISSLSSRTVFPADKTYCHFLKKWRKPSKRIIQKCFGFLRPLYRRVGWSRKSIRVDDIDRKVWEVQSWSNSLQASPQHNPDFSTSDWDIEQITNTIDNHRSLRKVRSWSNSPQESLPQSPSYSTDVLYDIESSIYEAVLHCKRSIDK